jgi:hypothetical protein
MNACSNPSRRPIPSPLGWARSTRAPSWITLGLIAWFTFAVTPLLSAAPATFDPLTQTEANQQQLRSSTARIGAQLDLILEEFTRSDLAGDDVALLTAIRSIVGQLTEDDMQRVVGLLQQARDDTDTQSQRSLLFNAFSTQKSVGLKLRRILLEYQSQQELTALAARLEELAQRQHNALRDTVGLAASAAGRKREWLAENQRILLQLQLSEHQSLRDEWEAVLQRLAAWPGDPDNDAAARAAEALQQPGTARLAASLDRTIQDLSTGRFYSASGHQRATRGLFRQLARNLSPPLDDIEAVRQALRKVESLLQRQESSREQTRLLPERNPTLDPTIRTQADLVDDTDVSREQVALLDSAAAEQLGAAIGRMQEVRGALEGPPAEWRGRRLTAATQQELALSRLDAARRLLQQRLDTLERQRQALSDPRANLAQVRQDVAELIAQETELMQEAAEQPPENLRPLAPRQGDLGDRTSDTAERASLDSPEAASSINEAATQMRSSQRSLGQSRNAPGAQQAAIDALNQALETLDQQLAELDAAEQELQQLLALVERLLALIEVQQNLNSETLRLARDLPTRPIAEVGRDQDAAAVEARELEGEVPPTVPQAATYLDDAAFQQVAAGNALNLLQPEVAQSPQDEALQNLRRALDLLQERVAQLKEMLGLPQEAPSLEELAEAIREAQQQVNDALANENPNAMGEHLRQAGQRIRPAASGRLGRLPRMIRDPLQQADRSLDAGAAAAESADLAEAQSDAANAQAALAAAAAALDLAMAGMGQQPGQGQGQSGEGNQMGQGQGQGRGRQPGSVAGRGTGDAGNFFGAGGGDGPRRSTTGSGRYLGLPARERAALLQSQEEDFPREYAPLIEQYLRNLSEQTEAPPE